MEAAAKSGRARAPGKSEGPQVRTEIDRLLAATRQTYLDALPIAAAIIAAREDGPWIDCANDQFRQLAEWDERLGDGRVAHVAMLDGGPIGSRLSAFFESEDPAFQFETPDGRSIGGRHFTVRFSRLMKLPGQPQRFLVSLIDRTAQVETEKSLRSEMQRDSLTGLPNRFAFNERVESILSDPKFADGKWAVLAADMTRFSRVNECMGALAGDELLVTFARRLVSALRPTDMLARTAGDEFGILMRLDRGIGDALRAAERIKAVLMHPFRLSELEIRVDCAIGCALVSTAATSADEILRNAQFALKRAKRIGMTQIFEPIQAEAVRRRFSLETELRCAIEVESLELAFQPLIDLETKKVTGFEALSRWTLDGRSIPPSDFIPVAEESGLIVPLGRWAIEKAVATLADWDARAGRKLPLSISVNLSPIQISRDNIAAIVSAALIGSGIEGERLTLELTEGAIIHDPDRVAGALNALKRFRVRIAMDDFGTGFTSLASLQKLPIDLLKIDKSFVSAMLAGGDSTAIVRAILSLARALGMETTAEGVDCDDLAELLTELGCTTGQGYHFARPMPPDQAYEFALARIA